MALKDPYPNIVAEQAGVAATAAKNTNPITGLTHTNRQTLNAAQVVAWTIQKEHKVAEATPTIAHAIPLIKCLFFDCSKQISWDTVFL